jgi:hypothetical protein
MNHSQGDTWHTDQCCEQSGRHIRLCSVMIMSFVADTFDIVALIERC